MSPIGTVCVMSLARAAARDTTVHTHRRRSRAPRPPHGIRNRPARPDAGLGQRLKAYAAGASE